MNRLPLLLSLSLMFACGDDDATDAATEDATATDTSSGDSSSEDASADDAATGDASTDDAAADDAATDDAATDDGAVADAGDDASSPAECTVDADCMLVSDCCQCDAAPTGSMVAACGVDCLQPFCQAAGIEAVACKAGVCVLDRVNCDERLVTCDVVPPICGPGTTPHVAGGCYSGLCVPVEACDFVRSCDDCTSDQTCVTFTTMLGPQFNCAPVPASCGGIPDCACLGDEICTDPYMCNPSDPGEPLSCFCPVC